MTPLELEIGTGRAHFLFERAKAAPTHQIIGIEYKARWITQAINKQKREGIYNITPIHGHAWEIVPQLFKPESLSLISLHFPDPWWKKRHHKRRILNKNFLEILFALLKPEGQFFFQTDVYELFELYTSLLESYFKKIPCDNNPLNAQSHREKKCIEQNLPIYRALFIKSKIDTDSCQNSLLSKADLLQGSLLTQASSHIETAYTQGL